MSLLDFARGPALEWSLYILLFGLTWRIIATLSLGFKKNFSAPRQTGFAIIQGAIGTIISRSFPRKNFWSRIMVPSILGYIFHIGLVLIVFFYPPHILYFKELTGLSWPGLPPVIIEIVSILTIGALLGLLVRRLTNKVLRTISNWDDYFSWFVTLFPIITGLLVSSPFGRYETLLAIHILSVCLLFVWLPFGKLAHLGFIFISRAFTGAIFARRGART